MKYMILLIVFYLISLYLIYLGKFWTLIYTTIIIVYLSNKLLNEKPGV